MYSDRDEPKNKVADFYSRVASIYDQVGPNVFTYFGQRMVELANIPSGARVLDIATGRGANLFEVAERMGTTGQVVGIDIAAGMVKETCAAIQQRGLLNATVLQMDAEHLTFADASFDFALCNFAIFWFPQQEQALSEFLRVLLPRGLFGVTLPGGNDERWHWYQDLMNDYFQRYQLELPPLGGQGTRDFSSFQTMLANLGFEQIQSIPVEGEMLYANEEEWWAAKWMHGERYPLENMPQNMLAAFKAEVIEHMAPLRQTDGFHERWRVICVFARKPANDTSIH